MWLRQEQAEAFVRVAPKFGLRVKDGSTAFPDRVVCLLYATLDDLQKAINHTDAVSELRRARANPAVITRIPAAEQAALTENIAARVQPPEPNAPVLCLLDGGINEGHPLLTPAFGPESVHTWKIDWGTQDDDEHGTAIPGSRCMATSQIILMGKGQFDSAWR